MISLDSGLLGVAKKGNVRERHKKYGEFVNQLDIIVLSNRGFKPYKLSENVHSYPTNSWHKAWAFWKAIRMGRKLAKGRNYDFITVQDPFLTGLAALFLKKKLGAKLLIGLHADFLNNPSWVKENPIQNRILDFLLKRVLPHADHVRSVSQGIKVKLTNEWGLRDDQVTVIPTPLNIEVFQKTESDPQIVSSLYPGKKVILFVGRLENQKDILTLLDAFKSAQVRDKRLVLVGEGTQEEVLKNKVAGDHIEGVDFVGSKNHKELKNYYTRADILVLCSLNEGLPKVIIEAGLCGTPTIATDIDGSLELIDDGVNGKFMKIGAAEVLANHLELILGDDDLRKRMSQKAQEYAEKRVNTIDSYERIKKLWGNLAAS